MLKNFVKIIYLVMTAFFIGGIIAAFLPQDSTFKNGTLYWTVAGLGILFAILSVIALIMAYVNRKNKTV